jgi:hypothetical protein
MTAIDDSAPLFSSSAIIEAPVDLAAAMMFEIFSAPQAHAARVEIDRASRVVKIESECGFSQIYRMEPDELGTLLVHQAYNPRAPRWVLLLGRLIFWLRGASFTFNHLDGLLFKLRTVLHRPAYRLAHPELWRA